MTVSDNEETSEVTVVVSHEDDGVQHAINPLPQPENHNRHLLSAGFHEHHHRMRRMSAGDAELPYHHLEPISSHSSLEDSKEVITTTTTTQVTEKRRRKSLISFELGTRLAPGKPEGGKGRRFSHMEFSTYDSETTGIHPNCVEERTRRPSWWSFLDEPLNRSTSRIEFIDDSKPEEEPVQEEGIKPPAQEDEPPTRKASVAIPKLPFNLLRRHKDSEGDQDNEDIDEIIEEPHLFRYVISLLGYSVNLAALWRFPYLFHKHGGGAFIVAYLIVVLGIGLPVCFLETALGDFTSLGPISSWNCVPLLRGLGYASVAVCSLVALEMSVITAWIWHYVFLSFEPEVPWMELNSTQANNITREEVYFMSTVVQANKGLVTDGVGSINWELSLCLTLVWAIIFVYLFRSDFNSKKTYYISAVAPLLGLCIIFGAGLSVGRDIEGLQPIFSMTHHDLASGWLWLDAVSQLAWALGMSNGVSMSVASLGMFPRTRAFSNTFVALVGNLFISILASLTTSSHLGNIAHDMVALNKTVYTAVTPSVGSPFVLYTNGTTVLPVSTMWAILFFLVLVGVGIHSLRPLANTLLMFVLERGPASLKNRRALTLFLICLVNIVIGLLFVTEGGIYLVTMLDSYCTSWSVCIIAIVECATITYLYGLNHWIKDLSVLGNKLKPKVWKITWGVLTPCALLAVMVASWGDYSPARFGGKDQGRDLDTVVNTIGIIIAILPALIIPCYCLQRWCLSNDRPLKELLHPTPDWGPATKAKKWVLYNLKSKYNINPDPVLMVKVDSLGGIPMGFYRYPQSTTTRQRKTSQEELQKKLEGLLKTKLSSAHLSNLKIDEDVEIREKPAANGRDRGVTNVDSVVSTMTQESEISPPNQRKSMATSVQVNGSAKDEEVKRDYIMMDEFDPKQGITNPAYETT